MRKIVVKFGGSNLKTAADLRRSAAVAAAYGRPLVIVVSAFAGVTDALIRALEEAVAALEGIDAFLDRMRLQHFAALDAHSRPGNDRTGAAAALEERLAALARLLKGVHYLGGAPDFARDAVLSYGERLSAPIVAAALRAAGLDAAEALPEAIGLATDGRFGNASADPAACRAAVAAALSAERCFVVPGFYGVGPDGKTTIFGRGGSDYTAALLARCLDAESLDLWKDVDGFLSCDPRLAPDSRTIAYLSYAEAAELSYFGAKVLHPRTVEPLEADGIPIRVMNVERFAGRIEPFSRVGPVRTDGEAPPPFATAIKSVASSADAAVVRLEGPGVGSRPGILARAAGRLDAAGVNILSVITAQTCINLLFRRADLGRALAVLKAEAVPGVLTVEAVEDLAIVAAVGEGIRDNRLAAARVLSAAADAGIRVVLAQAGASPVAVYLIVAGADRERTVRAVHDAIAAAAD
jgi:aspartate kinase/aspartokinase/homoserine dehydrogenase 1